MNGGERRVGGLYCRCGHVTKVWYLRHFNERSYHNLNFIRIWPGKTLFWGVVLDQVQLFGTGARYDLKVLRQCGKRVKTKSKKVLGVNTYVCRSHRGKTGRARFCHPLPPIQNTVNLKLKAQKYICPIWKFKNVSLNLHWRNGFYFIVI